MKRIGYKNRFGQFGSSTEQLQKKAQLKEHIAKAEMLSKKTHFNPQEILSLFLMFQKLISQGGKMDRLKFREVLHTTFDITDDVMLDRIFRTFDSNNDSLIDEVEWVTGISVLVKGTNEERISFCYYVYDINGDRSLAREELYHCLKNCLLRSVTIDEDIEESIKDIVEMAMKKLDVDRNGQITYSDFQAAVEADPFLLEAIGPCLPSPKVASNFLATFLKENPVTHWKTVDSATEHEDKKRRQSASSNPSAGVGGVARRGSSAGWPLTRLSVTPPRKLHFSSPSIQHTSSS